MKTMMMTAVGEGQEGAMGGAPVGSGGMATPILVFTVGERAAMAVSAAIEVGQPWWGAPLPMWRLDVPSQGRHEEVGASAGLRQQLTMLCADVAAAGGYRRGTPTGVPRHRQPAPLPLWLVLDLTETGNGNGGTVGTRRGAQALQVLQLMDVVAWQRLQVAVRPQVLLLVKAGDQRALEECRQRLEVMAPEPYWVIGLTTEEIGAAVSRRAATIAAALLGGNVPAAERPDPFPVRPIRHFAVGASAYPLPVAQVQQAVALWGALAALRECAMQVAEAVGQREDETVQATAMGAEAQCRLAEGATLAATIPGPVAVAWGRGRPRWWRCALAPARTLLAQRQVEQTALRNRQRTMRQQWLATQLTAWSEAWQRFTQTQLTSRQAATKAQADVGAYETILRQLWDEVLAQVQGIDEELATLAEMTTRAQAALQACSAAVDECCRGVPTLSLGGIWQWCTQPGQWGRWWWTLLVRLPRRVHALAGAVAACEAAVYAEANLHLVRQLGLAILQDVQVQRAWLPTLRGHLQAAISVAEAQLAEGLAALPAPWTPDLVAALWQALAAEGKGEQAGRLALDGWLQQTAAEEWSASGAEGMVTMMTAAFAESSQALAQWSAAEWLTAMFPKREQPEKGQRQQERQGRTGAETDLWPWLDGLAEAAQAQWPADPAGFGWRRQPPAAEEGWLFLPTGQSEEAEASRYGQVGVVMDVESRLQRAQQEAGVRAWLKAHPGWQRSEHCMPVILLLRRRALA